MNERSAAIKLKNLKLSITEGNASVQEKEETHGELSQALRGVASDLKKALKGENIPVSRYSFDQGTEFQKKVWRALPQIPFGQTRSYQWVAEAVGRPKAVRAVANAIAANPLHVLVPCHRVCPKSGAIGGFAAGVSLKKKLLEHEQAQIGCRERGLK